MHSAACWDQTEPVVPASHTGFPDSVPLVFHDGSSEKSALWVNGMEVVGCGLQLSFACFWIEHSQVPWLMFFRGIRRFGSQDILEHSLRIGTG